MPKAKIRFVPVPTVADIDGPEALVGRTVRSPEVAGQLDGRVTMRSPTNTADVLVAFGHNVYHCHWCTLEVGLSDHADVFDRLDAQPKSPDGIQRLVVDVHAHETAPNPASSKEAFRGPVTLSYVQFPDGGIDVTIMEDEPEEADEDIDDGIDDGMQMTLDGDERIEVDEVRQIHPEEGSGAIVEEGSREWYVFDSFESAGSFARKHWADMPASELRCIIGDEVLVAWALGEWAGPGSTQVRSLGEWFDLHKDAPEETLASYDGESCDVDSVTPALVEELGFTPVVAYRIN